MLKHVLWAALATSCVITSALSMSACGEVESCKPGSDGCVDGPPKDGKCKFDLVLRGGKCIEPDGTGPDTDSGTKDSGPASVCGECDEPTLCVPERKECVDFCATPEEIPGTGTTVTQITCGGEAQNGGGTVTLDFAETCKNTCLLTCRWQNWFCSGAKTDCATECEKPYVQADCALPVTGCGVDLVCQKKKCTDVRALGCIADPVLCPKSMTAPVCDNINCSNKCADMQSAEANNFDGFCDDGAYTASNTDLCPFGTDCADCGPRMGAARPVDVGDIKYGEPCPNSARCIGRSSDYDLNKSWCLDVAGEVPRCLLDCSGDDEECPKDFKCEELNNSSGAPLEDQKGRRGKVCFPNTMQCL